MTPEELIEFEEILQRGSWYNGFFTPQEEDSSRYRELIELMAKEYLHDSGSRPS